MAGQNKRVDQETWDKLLEAYRLDPGNHSAAARYALVQRATARRAWEHGNPGKPWGVKPIKVLIAEDVELARSRVALEQEREELHEDKAALEAERDREAVRQHAIAARKEEAMLVVLARQASIRGLAAAAATTEGLKAILEKLGDELKRKANGSQLSEKELLNVSNMTRRHAALIRELTAAGQMAMEMERLYMGEPTEIIGVQTEFDEMPTHELVKAAGYQDAVLQRAAARGLVVLDGGKGKPTG